MAKKKTVQKRARTAAPKKTVKFGQGAIEVDDDAVDIDAQQPPLIPMSEQELKDAGRRLAEKVRELKEMTTRHQGLRTEMKEERTALRDEIETIAQTIRQQGR